MGPLDTGIPLCLCDTFFGGGDGNGAGADGSAALGQKGLKLTNNEKMLNRTE